MQGLHLIADVYGIGCDVALLADCNRLQQLCMQAVETAGLTSLQAMFHGFESSVGAGNGHGRPENGGDGGVTGVVLLAESHVAIHTWPELSAATLDVYVCNHQRDNRARAQSLFDALLRMLSPQQVRIEQVWRGDLQKPEGVSVQAPLPEPLENEWLNPDTAYGLRVNACLFDEQSAYQRVRIFDTAQFGRTLKIDDHFMTSEGDEFFYHESMVHPAAITHPSPRTALVIGGGDGGSSEELLKHPTIDRITLVELDEAVLRASRAHLPTVHRGSLDDSRVDIRIEEGLHYLARCADKFDLILFDLTDPAPDSQAQSLYSRSAFQLIRQHLEDSGAFVLHVGSPTFNPAGVRTLLANLRATFRIVRLYGTYIPLYGCYWCMALCSDSLDPLALDEATVARRIAERGLCNLSLYTPRMHFGLFVLPAFVEILSA